jgi:hypothetical protein
LAITTIISTVTSGAADSTGSTGATGATGATTATGAEAQDHVTVSVDQIINVCYGTWATPPTANITKEGALYIQNTS